MDYRRHRGCGGRRLPRDEPASPYPRECSPRASSSRGAESPDARTAKGLPGYYPGARHNPAENLVLGAELLSELYVQTHSWHYTFAEYYDGSLPPGYRPGMPWSQASSLYNFVPSGGNAETVTAYADQMVAEMGVVARQAPTL